MDVTLSTVALVGPPNSGKSSLFNRLTGARQRVANYAGVTVDCREGVCALDDTNLRLLDLPGLYSLRTGSAEERLSQRIVSGHTDIDVDAVACVVDAANPELGLLLALDLLERPRPLVLILTAADLVDAEALEVARTQLERELAVPVITNSSTVRGGSDRVRAELKQTAQVRRAQATRVHRSPEERLRLAQALARDLFGEPERTPVMRWLDQVTLHAVLGPALLAVVLFFVFQAVFAWSVLPSESIEAGVAYVADAVELSMAPGALRDLLTQAVLGGVGGVLVFLPPILILFAFLVVLEESGYLPRAAFVLDPMMASIGLSGRSFIPLLSSFACAVPGIMATRTIPDSRTRATTMLLAPLMTCSARLPVYALLIGAFVPSRMVAWGISLQGLVMFCLYAASIACALLLAGIVHACRRGSPTTLMMELPSWRRPTLRAVALALRERAVIFLRRVGGILLALSVLMWGLTRFPAAPADGDHPAIYYSAAGIVGRTLQPLLAPLGFDWQVSIALVPGLAAREVAVAALGTMYAAQDEGALQETLASRWSMATAMSLLAWFIFAPQCFSTIAVLRRETGRWSASLGMTAGYFALAWLAAFFTYTLTSAVTGSS